MAGDHWNRSALQWKHVGQPLRPGPEDIQELRQFFSPYRSARALLLGVTPEIARAAQSAGVGLIAVDRCPDMIRLVWPGVEDRDAVALCGDWNAIPLATGSVQCVVGDGGFTLLDYPRGYRRVFEEVHRVLSPGGGLAIRYFCRTNETDGLAHIEEDLRSQRIENVHVLKWRLAMALHQSIHTGVAVAEILQVFNRMVPEREKLELHMGWDRKEIDTLDVYRGSPAIYTFPTLEEIREISDSMFFEISMHIPQYELGSCCPTMIYRRRPSSSPNSAA